MPDLLIAAAAEELDLIVLHYDADFDRIASVTGQRGAGWQCRVGEHVTRPSAREPVENDASASTTG